MAPEQQPDGPPADVEEVILRSHDAVIKESRRLNFKRAPRFVSNAGSQSLGDTKQVVLADSDGLYPSTIVSVTYATMTRRKWDDKHSYWTMDLDGQRTIVAKIGARSGITGYRPCMIKDKALAYGTNVAFDIKMTDADDDSGSGSSTETLEDDDGV
ncbi:MAG: hypothetical protein Q9168_000156 [Polycauliona sp. 1 TL-2023]